MSFYISKELEYINKMLLIFKNLGGNIQIAARMIFILVI